MNALIVAPGNTVVVAKVAAPLPAANEIRIRVHNVALNPVDVPLYHIRTATPGRIVGSDVAGIVDIVGERVTQWKVGDKAAGLLQGASSENPRPGGFAEYAILEADLAIHVPAAVSLEQAAAFPLCSLTAAQAIFIRLGINPPFPNPVPLKCPTIDSPTILIYSASTVVGLFAIELLRATCTPSGKHYRIFATANPKHHAKLLANGVEAAFDYRSRTWIEEVRRASGGISLAFDCISEDDSTAQISQTFVESGGTIAVVRNTTWNKDGIREGVTPIFSAVWVGLGHEISYNGNGSILPADPSWRAFSVEFFKFLSEGYRTDSSRFPIEPVPIRMMPGGLDRIVPDGFTVLGTGVKQRNESGTEHWMSPISGEKLVYQIGNQ